MVPRRTIVVLAAAVGAAAATGLVLLIRVHLDVLPTDLALLEVAAGLLILILLLVGTAPLRLRLLNRRLERALLELETGSLAAAENPLGALGAAFQEHYRLLWRTGALQRGTIAVQTTLIENLMGALPGKLIVLDGQGRVRYRSAAVDSAVGAQGDPLSRNTDPPIHAVIASLVHGEPVSDVRMGGERFFCYGVSGPVLLRRGSDPAATLEPREGLAYVVLSDREIANPRSRPAQVPTGPVSARRTVLSSLEQLFRRRRRER